MGESEFNVCVVVVVDGRVSRRGCAHSQEKLGVGGEGVSDKLN
jgi:hypothetical protein